MNRFLLVIVLLVNCARPIEQNKTIIGEYKGFFNSTWYTARLMPNQQFEFKIDGHLGNIIAFGKYEVQNDTIIFHSDKKSESFGMDRDGEKYLIENDSCLINIWTRIDLCKNIPQSENWSSQEREIYYPYREPLNDQEIKLFHQALNDAVNNPGVEPHLDIDSISTFYFQNFHHLGGDNIGLNILGRPCVFASRKELMDRNLDVFFEIQNIYMQDDFMTIDINYDRTSLPFSVEFKKEGQRWKVVKFNIYK